MAESDYVAQLNARYFAGQLPPAFLAELAHLPVDRADVCTVVERMFRLMRRGGFEASDLSPSQGEFIGSLAAKILPGAWEGRIPPITLAGRHRKIDQYLTNNPWLPVRESGTLLDLGCGFPPHTTIETADYLPGWNIYGVDPSIPAYLVYDVDGSYATFDEQQRAQYFQPGTPNLKAWNALLNDAESTRSRFDALLQVLLDGESVDRQRSLAPIEKEGARLLIDPVRQYERENLAFAVGGIGNVQLKDIDVVRCFNVLGYFDDKFRAQALDWFQEILREGGLLFCGTNVGRSAACRYFVYQKVDGRLLEREFAFSIDNFCPLSINSWYAQHDDDREIVLLMDLIHALRADQQFKKQLYARSDALRAEYGLSPRGVDGFYGNSDPALSPGEVSDRSAKFVEGLGEEGLTEQAVSVLQNAGYKARRNEVGHIAISYDGS